MLGDEFLKNSLTGLFKIVINGLSFLLSFFKSLLNIRKARSNPMYYIPDIFVMFDCSYISKNVLFISK